MREKKFDKNKSAGITLIALVVTIIVLLILAGVSIQMLTGDNGILTRAGEAKEKTGKSSIIEQVRLDILSKTSENNGENITEKEFINILSKYFNNVPNKIPSDLSKLDLISINDGYTINAKDIYDGKFKQLAAGLYDENEVLKYTWQELLDNNYITVTDNQIVNSNNKDMESILVVPDEIIGIKQGGLAGCKKLTSIILSNAITSITDGGISNCGALKTLTLGGKITKITDGAFSGTNSLTDIYYNESEGDWDDINVNFSHGNDSLKNATKHFAKETSKEVWAKLYSVDGVTTLVLDRDKDFTYSGGTLIKEYSEENQSYMANHRRSFATSMQGDNRITTIYFNSPVWENDGFSQVIINHAIYPNNTSAWFYNKSIFEFESLSNLKTKYSTDMSLMFCNAFSPRDNKGNTIQINLDLSHFETDIVTSMAGMFDDGGRKIICNKFNQSKQF